MRRDQTFKTASIAGASDLTIIAPIKKGLVPALDAVTYKTRVKRVLRLLHLGRTTSHEYEMGRVLSDAVERVGKIHSIRIAVLEPEDKVLLVVTFDGAWESYIRVIWQKVSRLLDLIFCNTEGYQLGWESSYDDWCAWLRGAQARTLFLYSQPNFTNTDSHYLRGIERIHQREDDLKRADVQAAKYRVSSAEENASSIWSSGVDLSNRPFALDDPSAAVPAFRQGLRTLVGLYRLSDIYMSTIGDGAVLHQAAQEMLVEFKEMLDDDSFTTAKSDAMDHYADAIIWFESKQAYERKIPTLPDSQDNLIRSENIQGGILHPYIGMTHGCLLMVAFDSVSALSNWLTSFNPTSIHDQAHLKPSDIAQNIAITIEGLRLAGFNDDEIAELPEEFVQGMDKRQGVLGDLHSNHPRRWRMPVLNWTDGTKAGDEPEGMAEQRLAAASVHAVINLRFGSTSATADPRQILLKRLKEIIGWDDDSASAGRGIIPLSLQWMHKLTDTKGIAIEHFGFRDAETNPEYARAPVSSRDSFDNQVHIGEVLHGYPNAADHGLPANGAKSERAKVFLKDSSFLVVRKLRQDVGLLNDLLPEESESRNLILAKMMGRWPADVINKKGEEIEGRPLGLGSVPAVANNFNFKTDDEGSACPFHAHIRRANPRLDDKKVIGSRPPRIVRRGMSYGDRFDKSKDKDSEKERGLMFMAFNASIGEQFEVIQRWISGGNSTGVFSGHSDPFLGVAEPGRPRVFHYLHKDDKTGVEEVRRVRLDGEDELHKESKSLVCLEWGMYLLTPSVAALATLANRAAMHATQIKPEWSADRGKRLITGLRQVEAELGEEQGLLAWKEVLEDPDSAIEFNAASVWAAIREFHGGLLKTPYGVLIANQNLSDQVLLNKNGDLTAQEYLPRMDKSFGKLYLGFDARRADGTYEKESNAINAAVIELGNDFKKISDLAELAVHESIDRLVEYSKARLDLYGLTKWQAAIDVRDVIENVIAEFCKTWFGLSEKGGHFKKGGMDWTSPIHDGTPRYPGHFLAPSRYVFQPHPSDTVQVVASQHGKTLNKAMSAYLSEFGTELKAEYPIVKIILEKGVELGDTSYAARTLLGLMMGFVPTTDGLMRRIAIEWAREGSLWSLRAQIASNEGEGNNFASVEAAFSKAFKHAFLLRAAPELLWRTAKKEHKMGNGTHELTIKPNEKIVVGQISATHEGLEQDDFNAYHYAFGDTRPTQNQNRPTHACPGKSPAMAVMRGFLKGLITCKQQLRPGPSAMSFIVEGEIATQVNDEDISIAEDAQLEMQVFTGQTTFGDDTKASLFAFGDSWVWQYKNDILFPKLDFYNFRYALDSKFSFQVSSRNYPADSYLKTDAFNYSGMKLADLVVKEELLKRRFDLLNSKGVAVDVILFSAGGNDIAPKDESDYKTSNLYLMLQSNATDIKYVFIEDEKKKFFNALETNYVAALSILLKYSTARIVIHGYDYPIPDGRSFQPKLISGPWLKPIFGLKYIEFPLAVEAMQKLIYDLNILIENIVVKNTNGHFTPDQLARLHYVNLTGTFHDQVQDRDLLKDDRYKTYWLNELHPTKLGYEILAKKIEQKLKDIGVIKENAIEHILHNTPGLIIK